MFPQLPPDDLPSAVRQLLEPGSSPRREKLLSAHPELEETALLHRVASIATENSSFKSKRRKILELTEELVRSIGEVAICSQGCAHCCHMPTFIYAHEAEALGLASGRSPKRLPYRPRDTVMYEAAAYVGQPCPFLDANHACAVYAQRPLICRLHHSLGDDPEACRIIEGFPQGAVPKIDPDLIELPYHALAVRNSPREAWGAIQDFFPTPP